MCKNTGLLQVFDSLDGMISNKCLNLTCFHVKNFPKEVPCVSDLKIGDLELRAGMIMEDTKGRETKYY